MFGYHLYVEETEDGWLNVMHKTLGCLARAANLYSATVFMDNWEEKYSWNANIPLI